MFTLRFDMRAPDWGARIDDLYAAAHRDVRLGGDARRSGRPSCRSTTAPRTATSRRRWSWPRRSRPGPTLPDPGRRRRAAVLRPGPPRRGHRRARHHQPRTGRLRARRRAPTRGVRALRSRASTGAAPGLTSSCPAARSSSAGNASPRPGDRRASRRRRPSGGPQLFIGGGSLAAARRAGRFGLGLIAQAAAPGMAEAYDEACREAGHEPGFVQIPDPTRRRRCSSPTTSTRLGRARPSPLHDAMTAASYRHGEASVASISTATTIEELRTDSAYRVVTVDEATEIVRAGGILPLLPLCGGLAPDVAWPYLRAGCRRGLPSQSTERTTRSDHHAQSPQPESRRLVDRRRRFERDPGRRPSSGPRPVGVWVHSPEKVGRDAGDLAGIAPLGLPATDDVGRAARARARLRRSTPRAGRSVGPEQCPTTNGC